MNNTQLEKILKSARVPERSPEYWEELPHRVVAASKSREAMDRRSASSRERDLPDRSRCSDWSLASRMAVAVGTCAVCLLVAFLLGVRAGRNSSSATAQLAEAQKCFSEIEALFPHQLQALVFDQAGMHLVLAERADIPTSPALYVTITGPQGAHRFVTFSGQRIQVNGDVFDVLVDRQGGVLLVGEQSAWSSSAPGSKAGPYRIEARPLSAQS